MKTRLQRALPDILISLALLIIPLLFFWPQTIGGRTLLPVDNLYAFQPFEAFAAEQGIGTPHNHLLSDLILENYAWKRFIRQSIAARQLPLWNPYLFAGVPFLAAGQHSALYPFSLIFYVMPLAGAYGWFTVSQLWLAGVNMYVLARVLLTSRQGAGRLGGLVAAVGYQLSGFYLVSVVFPMMIAGAAWLPFELAMIELALRQARALGGRPTTLPWAIGGAVGLGMIGLAGHVEILYYSLLVMAFYAAWRLIAGALATRRQPGLWGRLARRAGWLAVMVGLGLALGAVQVLPLAELASRSFRAGAATLAQVRGWAYPWRRLIAFLAPNFFGNPAYHTYFDVFEWRMVPATVNAYGEPIVAIDWGIKNYVEGGAYMGLLPLMLAAIALVLWVAARRPLSAWLERRGQVHPPAHLGAEASGRPYRAIFAALGLASFSFVFGTPTYALLYYGLPFINQLHSPFRWVWPLTLSVCILAAFGVEALRRRDDRPEDRLAARMARLGWGAIWGGAGVAVLIVLSRAFYGRVEGLVERVFFGLALAPQAFPDARAFYSYQVRQALIFAALLACSGIVLRLSLCPIYVPRLQVNGRRMPVWEPLAVGVLTLDLVAASHGFHPAVDPALLDFTPPVVEFLRHQDESLWRFASYDPPGAQTMNANSGWFYDLEDARGYDSLIPKQYADYMALIAPQGQLQYNRVAPIFTDTPQALDSPLLDLLDVRYVLSEVEIDSPKYQLVYQGEVRVYENLGAMPRAFSLPLGATVVFDDEPGAFAEIARQYDLRNFVALSRADADSLEALPGVGNPPTDAEPVAATITTYAPNEVWVDVQVGEPSWLVLADSNFPGWRAWARPIGAGDDQEVERPVWTVDGNFRGVTLEPGAWTVRFKYSPDSFKLGAFASFMAGVIVIFAAGVWLWRYAYRESPTDSAVRRVAKNSLAPIVLNLFTRGVDFAFAALMLRIVQPEGAGKFYYAVVIWGWFEIVTNFGLNTLLTRDVARDRSQAGRYLVNTSLLRLALAGLGVPLLIGFIGLRQSVIQPPLEADTLWVIGLLYVGLFPTSLSTGLTALFYAYEKAEHPAAITTVSAIVKASLGAVILLAGGGIVGVAGVSIFTNLVTLSILTALALNNFLEVRALRVRPDLSAWRGMLGESFPLMINHLLATLFFKIDVILLETTWSNVVVGWYSTAYKWLDALNIIPSFFTQAIFPVMSRQAHDDPPALLRTYQLAIKLLVMIALPVAVVSTLLARQLIGVLGGAAYLPDGAIALQLMIWSIPIGWINSITNYVLIALNRQRVLTWAFVVGVVFNVTANLIFLPRYSYPAAAIITILSELTLLVAFYIVLRSALGRVSWLRLLWRPALAMALMAGATLALARVHLLAGLGGGLAIYLAALIALRPLSAEEMAQIAPLLPRPIRARLPGGRELAETQ